MEDLVIQDILALLLVGLVAGFLAGRIMNVDAGGLVGNMIIGIIGAGLGQYIFDIAGVTLFSGAWAPLLTATIGAVLLLAIIKVFKK